MQASTHLGEVDTRAAGGGWGHPYDVDGNRVQTTVTPSGGAAAVSGYLVDTSGGLSQVVAESDGSGVLTAYYVRLGDELLEVMRPQSGPPAWSMRYVHGDGLGSVRVLTDESGGVSDSRGYEAFGTKNAESGSDPLAYGFAGEAFEGTSNLAYHRARWMDARVGRFEGMDPFEGVPDFPQGLHRYVYANVDPTNEVDPSGLISPFSVVYGSEVHFQVSADWTSKNATTSLHDRVDDETIDELVGGPATSFWSNLRLKRAFGVGAWARPDLAAKKEHVVMEIKSIDELREGQKKVSNYLRLLNELDPANTWTGGTQDQYTPIPVVYVGGVNVEVSPPENGVITYTPSAGSLLPQTAGATAIVALVAVTTTVALATLGVSAP